MRRTSVVLVAVLASCGGPDKYGSTLQAMVKARSSTSGSLVGKLQRSDLEAGRVSLDGVSCWVTGAGPSTSNRLAVAVSGSALCATLEGSVPFMGNRDSVEDEQRSRERDEDDRRAATTAFEISLYSELPMTDAWPMTHSALKVEYTRVPPPGTGVRTTNDKFTMTACGELPEVRPEHNFLVLGFWHPTDGKSVAVWRIEPASSSANTPAQGVPATAGTMNLVDTLRADGRFTVYLELLGDTDLATQLGSGDYTMFAFPDSAVGGKAGIEGFASLRAKPEKLSEYLSGLVVPGTLTEEQLRASTSLKSLRGASLNVSVAGGKIFVENSEIVLPPLSATNGIIFTFVPR